MLNQRLSGYLNYVERLATQPPNRWDGFYLPEDQNNLFALRFQIAFSCYALGALCLHPDVETDEQERCINAMAALIDRMLQRRVWAYWAKSAERRGSSPDPVERNNVDYSAHLAMMIGIFEVVGGDRRYDEPFNLLWTSTERFSYTHHSLVDAIGQQMHHNKHHGVDSEPGRTYATAMCPALWANLLHDRLHGSSYAERNAAWLTFLQRRMVLRGPRGLNGGTISTFYHSRLRVPSPTGTNLGDAWVLTMLAPLQPELVQKLAQPLLQAMRPANHDSGSTAHPSLVPPDRFPFAPKVSDLTIANGFGYMLAVQLGERRLATALLRNADSEFMPVELENTRYYTGGLATPYTTALFALGEAGGLQPFVQAATALPAPDDVDTDISQEQPFTEDDEYAVLLPSEPEDDTTSSWAGPAAPEPLFAHTAPPSDTQSPGSDTADEEHEATTADVPEDTDLSTPPPQPLPTPHEQAVHLGDADSLQDPSCDDSSPQHPPGGQDDDDTHHSQSDDQPPADNTARPGIPHGRATNEPQPETAAPPAAVPGKSRRRRSAAGSRKKKSTDTPEQK